MYLAKNGFTLQDDATAWGWRIQTPQDIITALAGRPEFETVADSFLIEAIGQAMEDRLVYADIDDLAQTLMESYL